METCGPADENGYCKNRTHDHGCGSAATPDVVEALRPQLEQIAHRPHLGPDGQPTFDRQYGAPMSVLDHIEAATGQRLGDVGLFERGRPRRELVAPLRTSPYSVQTVATAAALARQAGISTPADAQAQRAAWTAERNRQAAGTSPRSTPTTAISATRPAVRSSWCRSVTSRCTARFRCTRGAAA
jgi:hypothetical protein